MKSTGQSKWFLSDW